MKISPLPWCATDPVRASPSPIRRANRAQPAPSTGASVTTSPIQEPAGGLRSGPRSGSASGPSSLPTGTPATVSRSRLPKLVISSTPTVWPSAVTRDAVPMPPLKPRQLMPRARADGALGRWGVRADRRRRRASQATFTSCATDLHPPGVVEERVVALGHHRDDEVLRHVREPLDHQLAGGVVHAAELQRRGQEHRRLERAPLAGGDEAGALARAVEHRASGRQHRVEGVVTQPDHGDPGPGDARDPAADRARHARPSHGRHPHRARRGPSWSDRWGASRY